MKKEYSKFILIFIIVIFLEVIIFNITSYYTLLRNYEIKKYDEPEYLYTENDRAYFRLGEINTEVLTFKLELAEIEGTCEYQLFFSDETTDEFYDLRSKKYISDYEKSHYIPLYLSGEVSEIIFSINSITYEQGGLNGVILNEKIPFDFNIIRFCITLLGLFLIYAFRNVAIFNEEYSTKNLKQEYILLGVLAIFFVLLAFINTYSCQEENDLENKSLLSLETTEGIYNKDFVESLKQGKLYLLHEPTEEFLNLENPYDAISRGYLNRDYDYKWDTAFYNNHFYIYFGILPTLIMFLPFNLLTGGYLKMSVGVFIFSILIFILLKEILLKVLVRYFDKIKFKNVVFYLITLCSGALILYANGMSRMYEIVILAGVYFVLQGIYFILKSMEEEKNKHLNIFLGSLYLALSVACRPTDLFVSLIILPYLIKLLVKYIKEFKENKINLIKLVFAVAIPYIGVGIALMWYNYVRFGNVFDFGNKYQLTIVNMMTLGSRIFSIPVGIICNLFTIPNFLPTFPFVAHSNELASFNGYYYIENMLGGLFFIAPICFMIFYIFKFNKKSENKELKILVNSLVIVGLFIAILSVAMAGSNQRYLIDYAWLIILGGILIFEFFYSILKSEETKKIFRTILAITAIYTFVFSILSGIVSEKEYMKDYSSEEYYKTRYIICFWE